MYLIWHTYIKDAFGVFLLGGLAYALVRMVFLLMRKKRSTVKTRWGREIILFLFSGYSAALFMLLFSGVNPRVRMLNLIPFHSIREYLSLYSDSNLKLWALTNLVGNFLLFIPFSALLPAVLKKHKQFKYNMLLLLGGITLVEIVQYFIGRACDIDDVILGMAGGFIGYGCYTFASHIKSHYQKNRDVPSAKGATN